jgi:hypothetical protein
VVFTTTSIKDVKRVFLPSVLDRRDTLQQTLSVKQSVLPGDKKSQNEFGFPATKKNRFS